MNAVKIIRIISTILIIVFAFIQFEYAMLILAVLGLLNGFMGVTEERRLIYLVTALALYMSTGALGMVPAVGDYITAIFSNLSAVLNAGVLAVVIMTVKDRLTE